MSQLTKTILSPRPRGYWQNKKNVIKELRKIIRKELRDERGVIIKPMGVFPSSSFLQKHGYSYLLYAIRQHYKSFKEVRQEFCPESKKLRIQEEMIRSLLEVDPLYTVRLLKPLIFPQEEHRNYFGN